MRYLLCLLAISFSGLVFATDTDSKAVFKCADAEGKVSYQKKSCNNLKSAAELNVTTGGYKYLSAERQKQEDELEANMTKEQRAKAERLRKELEKKHFLEQSAEQAQKNQQYLKSKKDNFSPYALPPYQGKRYQDIVANFLTRLAEIERFRRIAAAKVLTSGQCAQIEAADLVSNSSINNLRFQVDCRNGKRIKMKEQDL